MNRELTWLEISRGALRQNAGAFRSLIDKKCRLMAVVKSNAYGHGLAQVVNSLRGRVDWYGVANLDEALELRRLDERTPVLVLSYFKTFQWGAAVRQHIDLPITSLHQLTELNRLAKKSHSKLRCQIKLDVGTSRIGLLESDLGQALAILKNNKYLELAGIFSHLADAENPDQAFTNVQNLRFNKYCSMIESRLGPIRLKHIACTAAALANRATHHDMVRIGIGLYGIWPDEAFRIATIKKTGDILIPVLAWKTLLLMKKTLPANTSIGYGRTHKLKKRTTIGVLPVGYNEGYDRGFSNKSFVLIRNQRAPIIGRVCMNLTMIELSKIKLPQSGDEVLVLGTQHNEQAKRGRGVLCPERLAGLINTIPYELVTRLPVTLPRIVVK